MAAVNLCFNMCSMSDKAVSPTYENIAVWQDTINLKGLGVLIMLKSMLAC